MNNKLTIAVTGAAGFLGSQLVKALLQRGSLTGPQGETQEIGRLIAIDRVALQGIDDSRLQVLTGDISDSEWLRSAIPAQVDSVFHLAAIVSSQAEQDFELGMKINVDAFRQLLEYLRQLPQSVKLVTTSSVAVFGGDLPEKVSDSQVWLPQSSYGTQKAICDLLLADYSRRGWLNGRSLRMPTIVVRPGRPNQAASSFASGIIREPLNGESAVCPVTADSRLWLLSPRNAIKALIHGHELAEAQLT
ncbi:NAD-dependent epimerase/dehydratase family protein, partial [Klebsiella aerogenes]|nr:NAD-dependent epimerase/dehydratase family protein [Klebsiella aerogenes]